MTKKIASTMRFAYPVETVLRVLTSPEFQEANHRLQGAISVRVEILESGEDRIVFDSHVTEYAKGLRGLDQSKTEKTVTKNDWDLVNRKCEWSWRGPHGDRAKSWGTLQLTADGGDAVLVQEFCVDIKIPVVGGQVEKLVVKGAKKAWPRYEATVNAFCAKLS